MGVQESSGYCPDCGRNVLIRRPGTNHVLHLLLSCLTLGLWLPVWLLCSIKIGGWRCTVCGLQIPRRLELKDYVSLGLLAVVTFVYVLGIGTCVLRPMPDSQPPRSASP